MGLPGKLYGGKMWVLAVHVRSWCSRKEVEQTLCKLEVS